MKGLTRSLSASNLLAEVEKTKLHEYALNGDLDNVKLLIGLQNKDTDGKRYIRFLDERDKFGNTALMNASWKGYLPIVEFLAQSGAHLDLQNYYGWTALMWAVNHRHARIVEYLISRGANAKIMTPVDRTAIDFADDPDIRAFLQEHLDKIQPVIEAAK